jgi:succinate dehydrogenase/fumarate reductase flavoprotein subunit
MESFDVIVVGSGPGGLAAACAAAEAGATVALVESHDSIGGNAVLSTGHLVMIDTPYQRERGLSDSIDTFLADAERQFVLEAPKSGLIWDRELTGLFARESRGTYDDLTDMGIAFARLDSKPSQHSVDRLHTLEDPAELARAFSARLGDLGVEVMLETEVRDLVVRGGRVAGIEAVRKGDGEAPEPFLIAATSGVVLATGGYQGNFELRRRYQPEKEITQHIVGLNTCRGMGHVLGASVGGDLINMAYIQPMVLIPTKLAKEAIAVNLAGHRFHDEAGPYARRVGALQQQPDETAYYIIDGPTLQAEKDFVERMPERAIVRDTLEELAGAIGCKADALIKTVNAWNTFLDGDVARDPATGRVILPTGRRKLASAPFAAMRMVRGISFTWGGLSVTLDMQVVTVQGKTVPGLFAVGDTIGGINVLAGMGGLHISPALTLGRLAGRAAATGANAAPHIPTPSQAGAFKAATPLKMVLFDWEDAKPGHQTS